MRYLLLAVVLCACGSNSSREFAVTIEDTTEMTCEGVSNSPALEQETLDAIAKDIRRAWEDAAEADPPTPEGRLLRVNETDDDMHAWFEDSGVVTGVERRFDSPLSVYQGDTHDDFIEGTYEDLFNTDEADEDNAREPCGDRLRASGILSMTDDIGVAGRIRWSDYLYIGTIASSCAAYIRCVRDIRIEGLEID